MVHLDDESTYEMLIEEESQDEGRHLFQDIWRNTSAYTRWQIQKIPMEISTSYKRSTKHNLLTSWSPPGQSAWSVQAS